MNVKLPSLHTVVETLGTSGDAERLREAIRHAETSARAAVA